MSAQRSRHDWSEKDLQLYKDMRCIVEDNKVEMRQEHSLKATGQYKHLKEPTEKQQPQLLQHDEDAFFNDDSKADPGYAPSSIKAREKRVRNISMQTGQGRIVSMKEIFQPCKRKFKREMRVIITGPAGSGKSTLLDRFAEEATNKFIKQMKDDDHLVHQVNCRELDPHEKITVAKFLFKTMRSKKPIKARGMEVLYRWMLMNQKKTTLIFDSLDTMRFRLEEMKKSIGPDDSGTPGEILCSILEGHLFTDSFVLASSREHQIKNYDGALRPDKVISLVGFTEESVKILTLGFLGEEEGEKLFNNLCKYPGLKELCETPVFLIFIIVCWNGNEYVSVFVPKSMAGVLVNLINTLSVSKHARTRERLTYEEFSEAINKMKELAYHGISNNRVLYTEEDFARANLRQEEVTDLAVIIPGRVEKSQQILETGELSFFVHDTIGELLFALKVIELDFEGFCRFASKDIHNPKYSVIRRIVGGVLYDSEVFEEASKFLLRGETQAGTE